MPDLFFNGDQLQGVQFNGDDLDEVYFNGDLVFQKNASSQLPVITSYGAHQYALDEGADTVCFVYADDPTGDGLSYKWFADIGSFDFDTFDIVVYSAAPDTGGQVAHIYCEVANSAGTVTTGPINISILTVQNFLCSVTNPLQSYFVSANNVVMGIEVLETTVDGNVVYRRLRYYARDENVPSGGWAQGTILMDWDTGVLSGETTVYVNGYKFGFTVVNGTIRAVSANLISGSGVSIESCGLSGFTNQFGLGHGIYLYTDAAGRFRMRYYYDSANDNYTKWFTPQQVEF